MNKITKEDIKKVNRMLEAIAIYTVIYYSIAIVLCFISSLIFNPSFRKNPIAYCKESFKNAAQRWNKIFHRIGNNLKEYINQPEKAED